MHDISSLDKNNGDSLPPFEWRVVLHMSGANVMPAVGIMPHRALLDGLSAMCRSEARCCYHSLVPFRGVGLFILGYVRDI